MALYDSISPLLSTLEENPDNEHKIAEMILDAPDSPERDALAALIYHEGIGVKQNLNECFRLAEKAAFEGHEPLGYYLLGHMCDNAETPDQAEGGPRQKYDHYDAESFYDLCARSDSPWRDDAVLWLARYYLDSARGGDPEIGVEYYESIVDHNEIAAEELSDYYWDIVMPSYTDDPDFINPLFKYTSLAAESYPEEYAYRLGMLYSNGIGCEKSIDKAKQWFEKSYEAGDWRGARSMAFLLEEELLYKTRLAPDRRSAIEKAVAEWKGKETEAYARSLEDSDEADPSQEED